MRYIYLVVGVFVIVAMGMLSTQPTNPTSPDVTIDQFKNISESNPDIHNVYGKILKITSFKGLRVDDEPSPSDISTIEIESNNYKGIILIYRGNQPSVYSTLRVGDTVAIMDVGSPNTPVTSSMKSMFSMTNCNDFPAHRAECAEYQITQDSFPAILTYFEITPVLKKVSSIPSTIK